jgi:hypothetical protein
MSAGIIKVDKQPTTYFVEIDNLSTFLHIKPSNMKKLIIGSLVGGIILFFWQFLSWTVLNLHYSATQYTPNQDAIIQTLSTQLDKDGGYMVPGLPRDATREQHEAAMESGKGKPWAVISYHKAEDTNMGMNMVRGLIVDILIIAFFCSIISRMNALNFTAILISALFTGMIVFLNVPYTNHIWFKTFDLLGYFIDMLVGWGLCGVWLGWWYGMKK